MFSPTTYQPARLPSVLTGTLLCLIVLLSSCTPMPVSEARTVIREADSLRAHGLLYTDSVRIADAYSVLNTHYATLFYPDEHVRACYHYGRLLRNCGDCACSTDGGCSTNYIAAMQTFISGTHAQYLCRPVPNPLFSDHATLARIYSNMGEFCHNAGEHQLSYNMFKLCASRFKKVNDDKMYYYAINAMALELAEQFMRDSTLFLLDKIQKECEDTDVIIKTWETKARLYINIEQYDSANYAAGQLLANEYNAATGYLMKAQSLWFMQQYDSALYYAEHVMNHPYATAKDKYNMLYILTYNDTTIDAIEVKNRSEKRDDINRYVLKSQLQQYTQATDMLKYALEKKPRYINLGLLLLSISIAGCLLWYVRRRHKQLKIETAVEQKKTALLQKKQRLIIQENESIQKKSEAIIRNYNNMRKQILKEVETVCDAIRGSEDWQKEIHWNDFDELCYFINEHFGLLANKLKAVDVLDEKEIRLCILVLLNFPFSNDEQAETIIYSKSGFGKFKYRMTKKLGTTAKDLREFLLKMILSMADFER